MCKVCLFFISIILLSTGCKKYKVEDLKPIEEPKLSKELKILNPQDKIWAHRVNSLTNIEDRIQEFYGIEIDIFYNYANNNFEVKHDLDSSGIDLEFFIDSVQKVKKVSYWFDYKNLNEHTESGISKLCSILFERELENVSLVESYFSNELIGFYGKVATSYWVSATEIPNQQEDRDNLYKENYKFINDLNTKMISATYEMNGFLEEYFPGHRINHWMSGDLTSAQISELAEMALSPNVNIILVDGNENYLN
jgi:hypothetical protein